jgi:hypothetical protein
MAEFHWRIKQGGMVVAGGMALDPATGYRESGRYAWQYASEGPMTIETRGKGGRWRAVWKPS